MNQLLSLFYFCLAAAPTLQMREIAEIPRNYEFEKSLVCFDSDHDSLPEIIFNTFDQYPPYAPRIEFWEYQDWNRYKLVYADTGVVFPEPNGIWTGNGIPWDAGDVDGDGLTDLACTNFAYYPDSLYDIIMTLESPDYHSYPCSLSWYTQGPTNCGTAPVYIAENLDHDGRNEIVGILQGMGGCIWKNVENDSNELVWSNRWFGGSVAFGDFCGEGRNCMATGGGGAMVWEDTANCQYERIWMDTVDAGNGSDVWSTSDIDGDGRPEFYISYYSYPLGRMYLYMYENESDGQHQFTRTLVDSLSLWEVGANLHSAAGDIDGDGNEECIWVTPESVRFYRAVGDDSLLDVWTWVEDQGMYAFTSKVFDVNNDGYNELLLGVGNDGGKIRILEVDAVDLLSPNGGSCSVGDTVPIRWAVNTPPRCDSLSLFLRRDSLWNLDTIATGLPGTDTLYPWVVPAGVPETARVVVIAYGPGWQFDISDSAITFIGGGVAEGTRVPLQWSLSVSPNPARGAFSVRYDVPRQAQVAVGIYDASGRLVRSLSDGEVSPGRYETRLPSGALPAGVYFCRMQAGGSSESKRVTLVR
jgi:hypothetical protein